MGRERGLGLLGIARRAGHAVVGSEAVKAAARRGRLAAIVVAGDATENAVARLGRAGEAVPSVVLGTRETLGRAVGKAQVAVVGITDRPLAERIMAEQEASEGGCDDDTGAGD